MFRTSLLLCLLVHVVVKGASAEQINQSRESFIAESGNVRPVENVLVANEPEYYQRAFLPALSRPFATPIKGYCSPGAKVPTVIAIGAWMMPPATSRGTRFGS